MYYLINRMIPVSLQARPDPQNLTNQTVGRKLPVGIFFMDHPSGSLKPSRADEDLTRKMREAAKYFNLKVQDHLVLTPQSYFSLQLKGYS